MRGLLRKVVPDIALDDPVRVSAGELLGIGTGVGMWGTIGIAFERDRGHRDVGAFGQPLFDIVTSRLAFDHSEPPAIVVDHDADVVRIVERGRAALECGVVEVPSWRREAPDEPRKLAPVPVVSRPTALRRE